MTRHRPTGWNTWDYNGFNRLVLLERGRLRIAVEYGIWDEDYRPPDEVKNRGGVHRHFRWSDVTRLGPHAPLGLPARLEFRAGGVPYRAEALDQGGTLALTLTPLGPTKQRIVFLLVAPLGEAIEVRGDGPPASAAFAGCRLALDGADWPRDYFLNLDEPYALGAPGQPATLRVTPPGATPGNTPAASATPAAHPELAGSGALADAPEAMLAAVTWNTLFDTRRKLVS